MTDLRIFNLDEGLTPINVVKGVEGFFIDNKSLVSEIIETPNGIIIQARPNEESSWKYVCMDNTIQVHIYDHQTSIIVIVGFGNGLIKLLLEY